MRDRIYPGKILLFGEYTILWDGMALSMPYRRFFGRWLKNFSDDRTKWTSLLAYIDKIQSDLHTRVDLHSFQDAVDQGWSFDLQIPTGKGLGSSGAVTAAFLDFFLDDYANLFHLKHDLALIESYFHGKSSGVDALVSLLNQPLLVSKDGIKLIDLPAHFGDRIYLVDTGIERFTQDLVPLFKKQVEEMDTGLLRRLSEVNKVAVDLFLAGQSVVEAVRSIGSFQFRYMQFLIPPSVQSFWRECLDHPDTGIKICGAGGGGYLLLFSKEELSSAELRGMQVLQVA